jgi:hypothetical protein
VKPDIRLDLFHVGYGKDREKTGTNAHLQVLALPRIADLLNNAVGNQVAARRNMRGSFGAEVPSGMTGDLTSQ